MKNKGGRPLKFPSVEELQKKIDAYFLDCDPHPAMRNKIEKGEVVMENYITEQKPYTITGLALALNCDRDTLLNYEEKEEYFGTIKTAKNKCQHYVEDYLFTGKNQVGAIFNLKNNYDWKDRTEVDNNINVSPEPLLKALKIKREDGTDNN